MKDFVAFPVLMSSVDYFPVLTSSVNYSLIRGQTGGQAVTSRGHCPQQTTEPAPARMALQRGGASGMLSFRRKSETALQAQLVPHSAHPCWPGPRASWSRGGCVAGAFRALPARLRPVPELLSRTLASLPFRQRTPLCARPLCQQSPEPGRISKGFCD